METKKVKKYISYMFDLTLPNLTYPNLIKQVE
jgi:hypothetical protein